MSSPPSSHGDFLCLVCLIHHNTEPPWNSLLSCQCIQLLARKKVIKKNFQPVVIYANIVDMGYGEKSIVGPFVRWAGGKSWLCPKITNFLPSNFEDYYEPFLGGGSVFFNLYSRGLLNSSSYLSDTNTKLTNAYKTVRDNPDAIIAWLKNKEFSEREYYEVRDSFNHNIEEGNDIKTAEFIYLNKQSFNGLFRVNRDNKYNVPFGKKLGIKEEYYELLHADSVALKGVDIRKHDFSYLLRKKLKRNSLVFIDPPYTVSHNNNGFIAYNKKLFCLNDQYRLLKVLCFVKNFCT